MSTSHCPICASTSITPIYTLAQDYITQGRFQVWHCKDCDIAFTIPQPQDLSSFYPGKYRQYNPFVLKTLESLYTLRSRRWSRSFISPGTAFEMGCGNGIMLNVLRQNGWRIFGNERTVESAAFANHILGLPIFVGGIDALVNAPVADLIILFQVLEHLEDPLGTLKLLNHLIKPDGKLIIGVPNFGSWQSKVGGEQWLHLDVPRHLFHFTPRSLEYCLHQAGFKIVHISYVSFEHDPYGWIQSLLNRFYKKHNYLTRLLMGLDPINVNSVIHLIIGLLLGIISLPISIVSWLFQQGAVIEVVAQKSN